MSRGRYEKQLLIWGQVVAKLENRRVKITERTTVESWGRLNLDELCNLAKEFGSHPKTNNGPLRA